MMMDNILLEIVLFMAFLYWIWPNLFFEGASRISKMLEVVTDRMFDAFTRIAPTTEKRPIEPIAAIRVLKRFANNQRNERVANRRSETQSRENRLYEIKENLPPVMYKESRPLSGLTCSSCLPVSRESLVNETTRHLGLKNILRDHPAIQKNGLLYKICPDILQVYSTHTFSYKQVADGVLKDGRIKRAIENTVTQQCQDDENPDVDYYEKLLKSNGKRAEKILKELRSTMSDLLLKITSWILYKILPCFLSSVVVHSGQIEMLKKASKTGLPLIFLPLHRSHLDYVMISFILQNNSIQCPLIAAGDNLKIPVFGSLLRGLGAFYIKRRMDPVVGQKDHVYKAILHSYMTEGLKSGNNLEFFLEGGRTRTGKPLMPKYGIFSIVVDAFMTGAMEDALLVPVSVNYEKLVDGNFIREQLGQPKQMETFSSAMKAIWQVLNCDYGMVRIDFNQPFSFRELLNTFNEGQGQNGIVQSHKLKSTLSTTSLYGTDGVVDEYQDLVEKMTRHVLHDCTHSTSIMSTNAIAFLLLHKFRDGVELTKLVESLDELRRDLDSKQKECGFSGSSKDVILYAIEILGLNLVRKEEVNHEDVIKPVAELPHVIELNYYSNTLTTHYALDAAVALALHSLDISRGWISEDDLIEASTELINILQYEFIFHKPCLRLDKAISDCIHNLTISKDVFLMNNEDDSVEKHRSRYLANMVLEDEEIQYQSKRLELNEEEKSRSYLTFLKGLLVPLIESYSITAFCLSKLVRDSVLESVFIKEVLEEMTEQLKGGFITYDESVSSDSIRNALKFFQKLTIVESYSDGKLKVLYLNKDFDSEDSVRTLCELMDKFRYGFQEARL